MDTYWSNLIISIPIYQIRFQNILISYQIKIKQETDKIKTTCDALKEKGIDIQSQAQKNEINVQNA